MIYKINDIDFSTFGLVPIQRDESNIAISGNFDMPARIGKTHHVWEEGVEPYVAEGEIFFGGVDITMRCLLISTDLWNAWFDLKGVLNGFNTLVELVTPYGSYMVYVKDQINFTVVTPDSGIVDLVFRMPTPEISEVSLPLSSEGQWKIDGIPFEGFGAFVTDHQVRALLPAQIDFQSTVYGAEGYKINRYGIATIEVPILISAPISQFGDKIKQLQYALMRTGLRKLQREGIIYNTFCKDGFRFSQVWDDGINLYGIVTIPFTYLGEAAEIAFLTEGTNQLTEGITNLVGSK